MPEKWQKVKKRSSLVLKSLNYTTEIVWHIWKESVSKKNALA
jgi:hypothetical protein